jgi:hypothetical protein
MVVSKRYLRFAQISICKKISIVRISGFEIATISG